jgi:hypothetical protein
MEENIKKALDFEFQDMDIGKTTPRKYLKALLFRLYDREEGFSGKRPFGNSGWRGNLAEPLIVCGVIEGLADEDGWYEPKSRHEYDNALKTLIAAL